MHREPVLVTDQSILGLSRHLQEVLRMHAVFARILEQRGAPEDATLETLRDFIEAELDELAQRRAAPDAHHDLVAQIQGLAALSERARGMTTPALILECVADDLRAWAGLTRAMRAAQLDHVKDASDA